MKKLLLINPVGRRSGYLLSKFSTFPPLGLAYVAAVTPPDWNVKILDENFDEFEFEEADLVGITAFTSNINRAYEIAKIYKERNIKVVMGGIHVSMIPDEASQYVDAVVVGEVEGIWEKILTDFEHGILSKLYTGPQIDFSQKQVFPKRELLHKGYFWNSVQTSRGCPFNCSFCSVTKYLGKEFRQRNVDEILDELESIKGSYISFVDDNLIGHSHQSQKRSLELFKGMIDRNLNKKWCMQTSIDAANDEEVIKQAAKSGCMFALIGFETISQDTLKDMKKGINSKIGVDNYKKVIDIFHKYGIGVLGSFIIGNDNESPAYYKELAKFFVESGVDIVQLTLLTPLPGTNLMSQLEEESRLIYSDFPEHWDKYRFSYMVHQPKDVDPRTVYVGSNFIKNKIYSFPTFQYRLIKSLISLKSLSGFFTTYKFNKSYKKGWLNSHYYREYPSTF